MPALLAALGAQLAGTGLEFAGGMMDRNARVGRRTIRRRGRVALNAARSRDALFGGLEESALLAGQKAERGGFQGARRALDLGALQARQGVQARGKQAQGELEQSIVSRGLLGTSTGVQALGGIQDRTTAQLSAIDMQLAQAFADLGLQEGELLGRQGRERTGLAGKRRAMEQAFGEAEYGLLTLA